MSMWAPSIVPRDDDQNVYLVIDDLGRLGRVWREADAETTDLETIITDLLGSPPRLRRTSMTVRPAITFSSRRVRG